MAPRGGRGGSSGSGRASSCPGAFSSVIEQASFAEQVLFLVAYLGLLIAQYSVRKKNGPGRKLIGIPFSLAALSLIITYALSVISMALQQCDTISISDYYIWQIPLTVFAYLSNWLLLFVVVYTLNAMLRQHLGQVTAIVRIICLAIVGLVGAVTCGLIGVVAYNRFTLTDAGDDAAATVLSEAETRLRVAYSVLYLLSVLAAGALALMTIFQLRSRQNRGGDLIGWSVALTFVMVIWIIIDIVFAASALQAESLSYITQVVLSYLDNFFAFLGFVFLICMAKHSCWGDCTMVEQNGLPDSYAAKTEQYTYSAHPNGQHYTYNGQANTNGHYSYQHVQGNNAPELVR